MPTRTYTALDIIMVHEDVIGSLSGTAPNKSASGSIGPGGNVSNDYIGYFYVDFTAFPSIPASARITRFRVTCTGVGITSLVPSDNQETVTAYVNISVFGLPGTFTLTDAQSSVKIDNPPTDTGNFNRQFELLVNFAPTISRDDLILNYGFGGGSYPGVGNLLYVEVTGSAVNLGTIGSAAFDASISNWTLEITYDLEHYSWYIKPTKKIVNGQPVNLIADPATDIVPVVDGDPIPDGFQFYATDDQFPSGLIFYWWSSPDFYQFFIFSQISPGLSWINLGTVAPTCTNCLSLTLENLSVLIADASGIYTLVTDKRNDTLYVRTDPINVITTDFKMPNPTVKIGFVP